MSTDRTAMYEAGRDNRPFIWSVIEAAIGLTAAWSFTVIFGRPSGAIDAPALVVALIAARYGYGRGVVTGLVSSAVALALLGLGVGSLLHIFAARAELAQALAYPLIGVLVGLVGDLPRNALLRANEESDRLASNLAQSVARHDVLLAAKEAVDRRVVGQVQTLASIYESARELETLDPRQIAPAITHMLARFVEAEAAAIYLGTDTRAELVAALGEHPRREAWVSPVDVANRAANGSLPDAEGAWLMAAVMPGPDGRPRGAILIESLPFSLHTAGTRQVIALVAEWAGRALANAETHAAARESQRDHPATGIRRSAYMEERLVAEHSAARRYNLALSLIMLRAPAIAGLFAEDEAAWAMGAAPIAAELRQRVRTNDVAGHFRADDGFLLILPCTPLEGARILASRIQQALPGTVVAVNAFDESKQDAAGLLATLIAELYPPTEVLLAG